MTIRRRFGTDGIRGPAGVSPLSAEEVLLFGQVLAHKLKLDVTTDRRPRVVVGRDTRLSGGMLTAALSSGLCAYGVDVLDAGVLPTPAIAWSARTMGFDAGVVVSASHNPFADNGIKLFGPSGFKLSDADEAELERALDDPPREAVPARGRHIGRLDRHSAIGDRYIESIASRFGRPLPLKGLHLVVDPGHGAASDLAPRLYDMLGARVDVIHASPNGLNINEGCGALHPEALQEKVQAVGADLGIALDGDADRALVIDERGGLRDGDVIMALCALDLKARNALPGARVVSTLMSNLGLETFLRSAGIELERTAVGDRYVIERMRARGALLGGEQSGHIVFLEHASTGDGLLTGAMVADILIRSKDKLSSLPRGYHVFPQVLVNVRCASKPPLESIPEVPRVVTEVESALGKEGRVLLRYSGTEPVLRIMIEGPDDALISAYAERIARAVRRRIGESSTGESLESNGRG